MSIHDEVDAERERAHLKHGKTSMRSLGWWAHRRSTILAEEVGEVATVLNDFDHRKIATSEEFRVKLREELIQTAAMAVDWIEAIDQNKPPHPDTMPRLMMPESGELLLQAVDAEGRAEWVVIVT